MGCGSWSAVSLQDIQLKSTLLHIGKRLRVRSGAVSSDSRKHSCSRKQFWVFHPVDHDPTTGPAATPQRSSRAVVAVAAGSFGLTPRRPPSGRAYERGAAKVQTLTGPVVIASACSCGRARPYVWVASRNRLPSDCTSRGTGGPEAHPEGTGSALPATGAAGTLLPGGERQPAFNPSQGPADTNETPGHRHWRTTGEAGGRSGAPRRSRDHTDLRRPRDRGPP